MRNRSVIYLAVSILLSLLVAGLWYKGHRDEQLIVGLVIPHHEMVAGIREAFLKEVSARVQPKTIILMSPDHFEQGSAPIVTTTRTWRTVDGDFEPETNVIEALGVINDDVAFSGEHGIANVLGPLKRAFPRATIVPIMVARTATYVDVEALVETLATNCSDCLFVASVDFSHAHDRAVASLHDEVSLRALENSDSELAYMKAEVDSPESLVALIEWARFNGGGAFDIFSHTNSGTLSKERAGEMTTHIMGAYLRGEKSHRDSYSFMIGGDTMFARTVANWKNPFEKLGDRFFWGVDDAVLNLEGVFDSRTDRSARREGWMKMPPVLAFNLGYANKLRGARVSAVGMHNNHSEDGGVDGYTFTKKVLQKVGIVPIGGESAHGIGVYKPKGTAIPVAYVTLDTLAGIPDFKTTMEQLRDYRTIVFIHWGREYEPTHNATQEAIAYQLVDLGADLIVGSHPHVIQDVEVYRSVPIVYSLGNFLFDQDQMKATTQGLVLGGVFDREGVALYPIPVHTFENTALLPKADELPVFAQIREALLPFQVSEDAFFVPYGTGE